MNSQTPATTASLPSPAQIRSAETASRKFQKDLVALIPHLRAFARVLCHQHELAEDLAQDTLVKAWRSRARFELGTNLKAWLFTILRNEFYSYSRRAWRQSHWDDVKGDCIAAPADAQVWALELSDTANALRQLPHTQREAVVLVAAGGFSYEEAAEICGAPAGTIKSRVARGRGALAAILDGSRKTMPDTAVRREIRATGAGEDILAQLSALTPAGARSAAYA